MSTFWPGTRTVRSEGNAFTAWRDGTRSCMTTKEAHERHQAGKPPAQKRGPKSGRSQTTRAKVLAALEGAR